MLNDGRRVTTSQQWWELRRPDHHHDGRLLKNGNVILLCGAELPREIATRVRGGRAGSEIEGGKMWADSIVEVTTGGYYVFDPDFEPVVWTEEERALGQAWGVPTVPTFHTYGTPPLPD